MPFKLLDDRYELVISGSVRQFDGDSSGWNACRRAYHDSLHQLTLDDHICIRYVVCLFGVRILQLSMTKWCDALRD
jgi:hypothetical protein